MVNETAEKTALRVDAAEFAAKCLDLLDEVARSGGEIVITRNGRPVSRLVPCADQPAAPEEMGADGAEKYGEKGEAGEPEKKSAMEFGAYGPDADKAEESEMGAMESGADDHPAASGSGGEFKSMFGADRGRLRILGDIVSPLDDIDWDAWADEQYELYYKDLGKPAS